MLCGARRAWRRQSNWRSTSVQLVSDASRLDWDRLPAGGSIGISAAASTPEIIVTGIVDSLRSRYRIQIEEIEAAEENVSFKPLIAA
jgi:4-hydroxy-3-methylbut-2-enyl diphosphate reductase